MALLLAVSVAASLGVTKAAHATTYTWSGGGTNGHWTTAANWQGNAVPPSNQDTALLFTGGAQLASNQNVGGFFMLNRLTFDNVAGAFTLDGNRLGFSTSSSAAGSPAPTLVQNSSAPGDDQQRPAPQQHLDCQRQRQPVAQRLDPEQQCARLDAGTMAVRNDNGSAPGRLAGTTAIVVSSGGTLTRGARPTAASGSGGAVGVGALTLTSTSASSLAVIHFGTTQTGSTLVFSSLTADSKGAYVSVPGFTGTATGLSGDNGAATNDRLLFASDPGFTTADLANWPFSNDAGTLLAGGGARSPTTAISRSCLCLSRPPGRAGCCCPAWRAGGCGGGGGGRADSRPAPPVDRGSG